MKDKEVQSYVNADKKARKFWKMSKETDNQKKKEKYQSRARDAYAERDAYGKRLDHPQTKITKTEIKAENSFNGNFNKHKTVNTKVKANGWFSRKSK